MMFLAMLGISLTTLVLLERGGQPWLQRRLGRLCQKWTDQRAAGPDGSFPVNEALRGRFSFQVEQGPWWRRPFGRIVLELTPVDPNAAFAFQVATKKRLIGYANPFGEKDGLGRLKRRYDAGQNSHAFWALMDKKTRTFFIANHLEITNGVAAVQIARSGLFRPLVPALLNRRCETLLKDWSKIATRALTTANLTTLADLLLFGEDEHLCRTALSEWMVRQPYDAEAFGQLPAPEQSHFPEYCLLWLYCGGPVTDAKRQALMADPSHHMVALWRTLFEQVPDQVRFDLCLTAAASPDLAETACRLLRESQNPLVVPHLIALWREVAHKDSITRGLLIEHDARTLAFFRELLNHRNMPTQVQGAYGLAALGDQSDLTRLSQISQGAGFRLREALVAPLTRLRSRLGVDPNWAGTLTSAQAPGESGALSQATLPDLALVTPVIPGDRSPPKTKSPAPTARTRRPP